MPPEISGTDSEEDNLSPAETPRPQALTCMGETAAAGGVFIGLGLRGVRGMAAAVGFGPRKTTSTPVHNDASWYSGSFHNWFPLKSSLAYPMRSAPLGTVLTDATEHTAMPAQEPVLLLPPGGLFVTWYVYFKPCLFQSFHFC